MTHEQLYRKELTMTDSPTTLNCTLENVLRATGEPLDSAQLFERPEVRALARSKNRVSDCLAILWREGKVARLPKPGQANMAEPAGWSYQWRAAPSTVSTKSAIKRAQLLNNSAVESSDKLNSESQSPTPQVDIRKFPSWARYLATLKPHP